MAGLLDSYADCLAAARKRPGYVEVTNVLKVIRLSKLREPRTVVEFGSLALSKFKGSLGDEKWTIYEQVFAACLDTGNEALANDCLAALLDQFKDSARVKRLVGMQQEAERSFSAASETYDDMLASNPANALAMKRRVAVLKGRGDNKEAVKELNRYLDQFQGDATAWQELADLYLGMSKYDAAAFCFEELVLHDPMNHLMNCRLAEIYYTLGNHADARKYYSQSLEIKKSGNARALHGLAACAHAIAEGAAGRPEVNEALHELAATELTKLYREKAPDLAPLLDGVLALQREALEQARR